MKPEAMMEITEDLLNEPCAQDPTNTKKTLRGSQQAKSKAHCPSAEFKTLVDDTALALKINQQELLEWLCTLAAPSAVKKGILTIAKRWLLNPLLGQIDWSDQTDDGLEVYIPIDGWIALIHREPNFRGMTFQQATETENNIPIWIECSIYRSDLIEPITVREYFVELKTDHPIWQQMPRRMMRHKILQQCARLAFGIYPPQLRIGYPKLASFEKAKAYHGSAASNTKALLINKLRSSSITSMRKESITSPNKSE